MNRELRSIKNDCEEAHKAIEEFEKEHHVTSWADTNTARRGSIRRVYECRVCGEGLVLIEEDYGPHEKNGVKEIRHS